MRPGGNARVLHDEKPAGHRGRCRWRGSRAPSCSAPPAATRPVGRRRGWAGGGPAARGWIGQTLEGSFSAVSKRNFASKYAFESSRRDLHDALLCTALQSQVVVKNFQVITTLANVITLLRNFKNQYIDETH